MLNGERGPQECRQCQKCVSLQESKGRYERAITAEWARITACKDCCLQGSLKGEIVAVASVEVREDTACLRPHVSSHLEACGKNHGSMCCCALCGCGYGTSRVYNRKSVQLPYSFYTRHLDRMNVPDGGYRNHMGGTLFLL